MPVSPFVDDPEPVDPTAPIRRYVEFWKLEDLIQTGELYFRRADKLEDEDEGLPSATRRSYRPTMNSSGSYVD